MACLFVWEVFSFIKIDFIELGVDSFFVFINKFVYSELELFVFKYFIGNESIWFVFVRNLEVVLSIVCYDVLDIKG